MTKIHADEGAKVKGYVEIRIGGRYFREQLTDKDVYHIIECRMNTKLLKGYEMERLKEGLKLLSGGVGCDVKTVEAGVSPAKVEFRPSNSRQSRKGEQPQEMKT